MAFITYPGLMNMAEKERTIRVFIASPGDLAVERAAFKEVVDQLNDGFAAGAGVTFEPLGWEDTLAEVGRRPQDVINKDVDRCDVFILAMHRRWGANDPDIPKPATSRTEEEYLRAYARREQTQSPRMFVFFKDVDSQSLADAGPQLKKVLAFKKKLEKSGKVLYRNFADVEAFRKEVDRHLRAVAKPDEPPPVAAPLIPVDMPQDRMKELEEALAAAEKRAKRAEAAIQRFKDQQKGKGQKSKPVPRQAIEELARAKADELALALAEQAAKAALEGRVEEARQDFAKATDGTTNLRVLHLAFEFYFRTGDLTTAEEMLKRALAISGRDAATANKTAALGNLGLIYRTRGDLKRAEEMFLKVLSIHTMLGLQTQMAAGYGNLGGLYHEQNDLERAEEAVKKSLAIYKNLDDQKGVATQYDNLGEICQKRGHLDSAEEMHRKALAINEKLGHQEGMAAQYGNLGLIYRERGDLDGAEEMFRHALAIDEKLDLQEYMANQYGNLGSVAKDRGEIAEARELWTKSRDLFANIGMPHMVKKVEGLLVGLPPVEVKK